jgi:uroporphyrinogen-III decarboxylase
MPELSIEMFRTEPGARPPDPSCFEVYDALIAACGEKFVIGCSGPEVGLVELGTTEQTLMRYALEPDLAKAAAKYNLAAANGLDRYYARAGIQAVLWGQDHAYVTGPMVSPAMFRELAMPVYTSRVRSVKTVMGVPIIKHACGNNWSLLDMYVEAGFDGYQSIQASAGMDLAKVKEAYGKILVLWGGLPLELLQAGTAAEVRAAVRRAAEAGKPGGRYIFGSSHSIAVGSKYDNFMAMLDEFERVAAYEEGQT